MSRGDGAVAGEEVGRSIPRAGERASQRRRRDQGRAAATRGAVEIAGRRLGKHEQAARLGGHSIRPDCGVKFGIPRRSKRQSVDQGQRSHRFVGRFGTRPRRTLGTTSRAWRLHLRARRPGVPSPGSDPPAPARLRDRRRRSSPSRPAAIRSRSPAIGASTASSDSLWIPSPGSTSVWPARFRIGRRRVPASEGRGRLGRRVGSAQQLFDAIDDRAQGRGAREGVHGFRVGRRGQCGEDVAQLAEDLDALDRVDSQIGLDIEPKLKDFERIPRAVANDLKKLCGDVLPTGRFRCGGWARFDGDRSRRGGWSGAAGAGRRRSRLRSGWSGRPTAFRDGGEGGVKAGAGGAAMVLGAGVVAAALPRSGTRASSLAGLRGTSASSPGTPP